MKKVTGEANTQPEQKEEEVSNMQYSQRIKDFIGKTVGFKNITEGFKAATEGFKTATEGLLNVAIVIMILVLIGFAIYTKDPNLLRPEAIPSQVTPEAPQEAPKIHLTV